MKKKTILIMLLIIIFIILIVGIIIIKPRYELNKAVEYIKEGEYNKAYTYINSKGNKDNIKIVKELISLKLTENMSKGSEQITSICNKGIEILKKVNINKIDYSLDDNLNIHVNKLEDYIKIKDNISKEMIIEDMDETYDLYFEVLEFVNVNFIDILNNVQKGNFISQVTQMSTKLETIGLDIQSIEDNYNFGTKTREIYNEIRL